MRDTPLKQGATSPMLSWRDQLRVWRDSHRLFAKQSFDRLWEKPLATLVTLTMLAIAIALPTLLHLGVKNVSSWVSYSDSGLEMTAYLHMPTFQGQSITDYNSEGQALALRVAQLSGVKQVEFISAEDALLRLEAIAGAGSIDIIDSLPANPLPAAIRVVVGQGPELASIANALAQQIKVLPEVESVRFNLEWFQKAQAIVQLVLRINLAASVLLGMGVVLVIGNTVRVSIASRREEILVAKLVGATNAYARRPFLYLGVWLGATGAAMALIISFACMYALTYYIKPLEAAYSTNISIQRLSADTALVIFLASASLGWVGSWVICSNQISKLEPE